MPCKSPQQRLRDDDNAIWDPGCTKQYAGVGAGLSDDSVASSTAYMDIKSMASISFRPFQDCDESAADLSVMHGLPGPPAGAAGKLASRMFTPTFPKAAQEA